MRSLPAVLALLFVSGLSGCPAHVMIDPPPPATSPELLRTAYYQQHAPEPPDRGQLVTRTRLLDKAPTVTQRSVQLKNGALVVYPEDLRPLVDADSETAHAIDASVEARGRADLITGVGLGVAAVGAGVGGGLIASYLLRQGIKDSTAGFDFDPVLVGGSVVMGVGLIGGGAIVAWAMTVRDDEDDARVKAFHTVDAGLKKKLALP